MSINDIRFRAEGALMVLQVNVSERDDYGYSRTTSKWRDATVEDMLDVVACLKRKYTSIEYRQVEQEPQGMLADAGATFR